MVHAKTRAGFQQCRGDGCKRRPRRPGPGADQRQHDAGRIEDFGTWNLPGALARALSRHSYNGRKFYFPCRRTVTLSDPVYYVRAVHFAATLLVAGVAIFVVFIVEPAFRGADNGAAIAATVRRRLNRIAQISLALAVISGAAWFDLTAAAMSGKPAADVFAQGVWWTVLSDTIFGKVWLARFVLACL